MKFATWEPIYEAILDDFGFDRKADEAARDLLAERLDGESPLTPKDLSFDGETTAIAGAGPSLEESIDVAADADSVIAASDAGAQLRDHGVSVDVLVTDLDGHPARTREFTDAGIPVVVHAHGDNRPALREYVPALDSAFVLPTTQAEPVGPVANVGGFTDGDRAAFLADHCGASELTFLGWDFDDPSVSEMKRRKLRWAERLLYWLERHRGDRFAVLDGRRQGIDVSMLADPTTRRDSKGRDST
jgi:uncharacterized Rossmann fold enzyme